MTFLDVGPSAPCQRTAEVPDVCNHPPFAHTCQCRASARSRPVCHPCGEGHMGWVLSESPLSLGQKTTSYLLDAEKDSHRRSHRYLLLALVPLLRIRVMASCRGERLSDWGISDVLKRSCEGGFLQCGRSLLATSYFLLFLHVSASD